MTAKPTTNSPDDLPDCDVGDYLLRPDVHDRWKVFLIEDFVRLVRLLPLRLNGGPLSGFIDEGITLDSISPAYCGQTHLLLTMFEADFASENEARRAVESKALGRQLSGVVRPLGDFSKATSIVLRRSC